MVDEQAADEVVAVGGGGIEGHDSGLVAGDVRQRLLGEVPECFEVEAGFVGYEQSFALKATEEFGDAATLGLSLLAGSELLKIRFGIDGELSTDATAVTANAAVKLRF